MNTTQAITDTVTMSAHDRRQFAIGMLGQLVIPTYDENGEVFNDFAITDREVIAGNIEKLAQLGRTPRWQMAIANWAAAVRDTDNTLRWAYLQYLVYASSAS